MRNDGKRRGGMDSGKIEGKGPCVCLCVRVCKPILRTCALLHHQGNR